MSYINEKLGKNDKEKIKDFLLGEGFKLANKNEHELYYLSEGVESSALITVDIQSKTIHSCIESNSGLGRAASVSVTFDYEKFEETYTKFISAISNQVR